MTSLHHAGHARAEWLNLVLDLAGFLEDQGSFIVWPTMGGVLRSTNMTWDEPGLSWIVCRGLITSPGSSWRIFMTDGGQPLKKKGSSGHEHH